MGLRPKPYANVRAQRRRDAQAQQALRERGIRHLIALALRADERAASTDGDH